MIWVESNSHLSKKQTVIRSFALMPATAAQVGHLEEPSDHSLQGAGDQTENLHRSVIKWYTRDKSATLSRLSLRQSRVSNEQTLEIFGERRGVQRVVVKVFPTKNEMREGGLTQAQRETSRRELHLIRYFVGAMRLNSKIMSSF